MTAQPVRIHVHNRADTDATIGVYYAHQVPAAGDILYFTPRAVNDDNPFRLQHTWRVDAVMWEAATPGSITAHENITRHGYPADGGSLAGVALLVWPAPGLYWPDRPAWAPTAVDDDHQEDTTP